MLTHLVSSPCIFSPILPKCTCFRHTFDVRSVGLRVSAHRRTIACCVNKCERTKCVVTESVLLAHEQCWLLVVLRQLTLRITLSMACCYRLLLMGKNVDFGRQVEVLLSFSSESLNLMWNIKLLLPGDWGKR